MKFKKNKSEKKVTSNVVNKSEEAVNAWNVINEKFRNINATCKTLEKSIQSLSVNSNLMKKWLKSQKIISKRLFNDTDAKLNITKNHLRMAKINNASLKRTLHSDNDNSKKIPGFPLELPN